MALHLCLLIGQLVVLHLKTKIEEKVSIFRRLIALQ